MVIFNSYVKLPEGTILHHCYAEWLWSFPESDWPRCSEVGLVGQDCFESLHCGCVFASQMVYTLHFDAFWFKLQPINRSMYVRQSAPHNFNEGFQHEFFGGDQHANFACAASGTKYAVPRASLASKFAKNWRPVWTSFDQLTFKILTCHRYHRWSRYCILSYFNTYFFYPTLDNLNVQIVASWCNLMQLDPKLKRTFASHGCLVTTGAGEILGIADELHAVCLPSSRILHQHTVEICRIT